MTDASDEILKAILRNEKEISIKVVMRSDLGDGYKAIGLLVGDWKKERIFSLLFNPDFELIDYEVSDQQMGRQRLKEYANVIADAFRKRYVKKRPERRAQ